MDSTLELEAYLHEHIPLSAAMAVSVERLDESGVELRAPLLPNINHRNTVFGGSLASLATLAAWALVHTRLELVATVESEGVHAATLTGTFVAIYAGP